MKKAKKPAEKPDPSERFIWQPGDVEVEEPGDEDDGEGEEDDDDDGGGEGQTAGK